MRSLSSAAAANKGFAKYGRQNIALKTLVILIGFCNLAVVKKSYGQAAAVILLPVLRKTPNVMWHFMTKTLSISIILFLVLLTGCFNNYDPALKTPDGNGGGNILTPLDVYYILPLHMV